MALKRSSLVAMGIESDKIDEIISMHSETVDALKTELDKYKEDAAKLPAVQKELDTLKAEQAKDTPYKEKYEKEHSDFEKYKADQTAKETTAKKKDAYKALLKEAGVADKHLDVVLRVTDLNGLELDDKGKLKDSNKLTESIKKDWADFIVTKGKEGAQVANPPGGNGGKELSESAKYAQQKEQEFYNRMYGTTNNSGNAGNKDGGKS